MIKSFHFTSPPITPITPSVSHLLEDADKKPADSLTKLAALDIDNLLAKTAAKVFSFMSDRLF